jgi:hypothetical protein
MFNFIKNFIAPDYTDSYTVQKTPEGRWAIYDKDGHSINDYSRRRDAIRGAERAGYNLV